jgi:hypothetical protein
VSFFPGSRSSPRLPWCALGGGRMLDHREQGGSVQRRIGPDGTAVTIVVKVKATKGTKLTDTSTVSATTGDTIPGNDSKSVTGKVS